MKIRNEFQAGILILVSLALFAASIWFMGRERQIFARQQPYYAIFKTVAGLSTGAPVRLGGISIGRVDEIGFSSSLSDNTVHVRLLLNEDYLERIRTDCVATIETQGLLGDRFVALSSGSSPNQLLPGNHIQTTEPTDIQSIVRKVDRAVDSVVSVTQSLEKNVGAQGSDLLSNVSAFAVAITKLLNRVEREDSVLHRLLYSPEDGKAIMGGLASSARSLATILRQVKSGKGALHDLIYDQKGAELVDSLTRAAAELAATAAVITDLGKGVRDGDGLLHNAIYNDKPHNLNQTLQNLHAASESLRQASESLANGDGTLGALLLDPTVYNNIIDVTDNAKRSYLLREAIRSSLQKPAKE